MQTNLPNIIFRCKIKRYSILALIVLSIIFLSACSSQTDFVSNKESSQSIHNNGSENSLRPLSSMKSDWQRINIGNVGTIDIPPTMEVQGGNYKKFNEDIINISSDSVIIQQVGLNDSMEDADNTYARILVSTETGNKDDYDSLTFDISEYSKADIDELDDIFRTEIEREFTGTGLELQVWYPLQLESINGMSCYHIKYSRKLNSNPPVMVDMYIYQNIDRLYRLTISYRIQDEQIWKSDLDYSLSTFRISR